MSGKLDQISGKVKETAGEVLNDSKLQAEGVVQQGIGKVKEEAEHLIDDAKEKAENLINDIKSKF